MTENIERDTNLLETLMTVVPNAGMMTATIAALDASGMIDDNILDMLQGYGMLINILDAAAELDDESDLHTRLSAAYYELTNNEPVD